MNINFSPKEMEDLKKVSAFLLRLRSDDKARISAAAKKLSLTTTEFLTLVAMKATEQVEKMK